LRNFFPGTTRKRVEALGAPKKKAGIIPAKEELTVRAMKKTNIISGLDQDHWTIETLLSRTAKIDRNLSPGIQNKNPPRMVPKRVAKTIDVISME
jgi:hypothetical protein